MFFKIDKTNVTYEPKYLLPDGYSTITVEVQTLNKFNIKIPFRQSDVKFSIIEGIELVEIISITKNKLILKSKYETGKVVISVKDFYNLIPLLVEIDIIPLLT